MGEGDKEIFDVAWVIADVAAGHQPDYKRNECGTCVDPLSHSVPWMCNTARVVMALSAVMDELDVAGEFVLSQRLRWLINAAINYTPPNQR